MIKYGWRTGADGKSGRRKVHARTNVRAGFSAAGRCKQTIPCERCKGSLTGEGLGSGIWTPQVSCEDGYGGRMFGFEDVQADVSL